MKEKKRIFLVEDDLNFGLVLKSYLEMNDYQVELIKDGAEAIEKFKSDQFDVCILDVMLPNMDGFSIAREIKKINNQVPVMFLTAKALKEDVLEGFRIGADDYLIKPFDSEVLLYKLKAIIKRTGNRFEEDNHLFKIGSFTFDYKIRKITNENSEQNLSPKEAELLRLLCVHINNVLSRDTALNTIWGDGNYFTTRTMDVHITKLRNCLKDDPTVKIENIHSKGFRLIAENI